MVETMLRSLILALATSCAAAAPTYLDLYESNDCSGGANLTVDLSASNYTHCTGCWDRCADAAAPSYRSMALRGGDGATTAAAAVAVKAALNSNCVGLYAYSGGWSDVSMDGVLDAAGGCHAGGAGAVVLCDGGTAGVMDDDLAEVRGRGTTNQPPFHDRGAGAAADRAERAGGPRAIRPSAGRTLSNTMTVDASGAQVCGRGATPPANRSVPTFPFYVLDPSAFDAELGDDAAWAAANVPFVDLPDADLRAAYYYRWRVFRKHIKCVRTWRLDRRAQALSHRSP